MSMKKAVVLDTTAIFTGILNSIPFNVEAYIHSSVIPEVKDRDSKFRLEVALQSNRVRVLNPPKHTVDKVKVISTTLGEELNLSQTDTEVLALALYLHERGYDVIVFSDDYSVQNLCKKLNIKFNPVKTIGIKRLRRYIYKCTACGYTTEQLPADKKCPICGMELRRKLSRS